MKVTELIKGHCYLCITDSILAHIFQFESSYSSYPDRYIVVHYPIMFTIGPSNLFMRCEKTSTKVYDKFHDEFIEIDSDTFFKITKLYEIFYNSVKSLLQEPLAKI